MWLLHLLFQQVIFEFQQLSLLTQLVKLCRLEVNDVPFYGYPLVSFMDQNVDVNTPLVLCS
jgi:hypothetical protein